MRGQPAHSCAVCFLLERREAEEQGAQRDLDAHRASPSIRAKPLCDAVLTRPHRALGTRRRTRAHSSVTIRSSPAPGTPRTQPLRPLAAGSNLEEQSLSCKVTGNLSTTVRGEEAVGDAGGRWGHPSPGLLRGHQPTAPSDWGLWDTHAQLSAHPDQAPYETQTNVHISQVKSPGLGERSPCGRRHVHPA